MLYHIVGVLAIYGEETRTQFSEAALRAQTSGLRK